MYRKSNFKSKICKAVVFCFMFQFVFSFMTSAQAFPKERGSMTCKTLGEWTSTEKGLYSESLGSSIIFTQYIEETGTYSIDFSNEVLGVKYEILQNSVSWKVGYGNFSRLPGYYNLNKGTYINVVLTVASNPIEISTISFTKLSEPPPIPTPTPWGYGVGGTYDSSALAANNPNLVRNAKYDCITELKDGDEIILNNVKPYGAEKIANPIDTLVICAAVDDENDGATISGFEDVELQSTGGKAPEFLEQVFTGDLQSYSDGLVTLKINGGTNVCDIKWIKLFNSNYPDGNNNNVINEAPETITETIGDLSGDGSVDAIDFAYMRKYLLGMCQEFPATNDLFVADIDGDLRITSVDFAMLRAWILKLIS